MLLSQRWDILFPFNPCPLLKSGGLRIMSKPKYKAVIFDFDDTLVETRLIKWAHHKAVAKKFYNIDLSEEILLKHWGKPFHVLLQELYQYSDTLENMMVANTSIRNDFLKKLYPGSVKVVTTLLNNNIRVGLLSAANQKFVIDDLKRFNFPLDRFSVIQGPDDTEVHKPNPEVFSLIFNKLSKEGIQKEEIVYVGDSLIDLQAAHGADIDFIAITTGLYSKTDFKKHGAKVIVKNIREVTKKII